MTQLIVSPLDDPAWLRLKFSPPEAMPYTMIRENGPIG